MVLSGARPGGGAADAVVGDMAALVQSGEDGGDIAVIPVLTSGESALSGSTSLNRGSAAGVLSPWWDRSHGFVGEGGLAALSVGPVPRGTAAGSVDGCCV